MVKFTERTPGVYPATFVKLDTEYEITDKDSGELVNRWLWVFQEVSDPTTAGQLDTISSPSLKPRTNGYKFFAGMLGRPPTEQDDTDDLIGQVFDVVYGPNQNGRLTVTGVMRREKATGAPAVVPGQIAEGAGDVTAPPDELPF